MADTATAMKSFFFRSRVSGVADWTAAAIAICAAFLFVAWASVDVRHYINVKSISIRDSRAGEPIYMDVARELRGAWDGYYSVEIRDALTGGIVCSTGHIEIPYKEFTPRVGSDGEPIIGVDGTPEMIKTALPDPLTLAYWAFGGSCTRAIANGLPANLYTQTTCHGILEPWGFLPPREECWDVTTFRVVEKGHRL